MQKRGCKEVELESIWDAKDFYKKIGFKIDDTKVPLQDRRVSTMLRMKYAFDNENETKSN